MISRASLSPMALALIGACGIVLSLPSQAQSSITLYGTMDLGVRQVRNGSLGTITSEASGNNSTSKWGLRGNEDLGGGTSAGFHLESTVLADTGVAGATVPAGQMFDRHSYLRLSNANWGEIRLGRDWIPNFWVQLFNDPFFAVGIGGALSMWSQNISSVHSRAFGAFPANTSSMVRVNNGVHYFLPRNLGGLYGQVTVSAGEGAASSGGGASKGRGFRLGYAAGPVDIAVANFTTDNTLVAGEKFKDTILGGSYNFGVVKVLASHRIVKFNPDKQTNTQLGVSVPLGQGQVRATYIRANQSSTTATVNSADASLMALGYVHDLSKRTAVYGHVARISNKGNATNGGAFSIAGGPSATNANFRGQSSRGIEIGVRHQF